jgi:hypothetical protein
MGAREVVADRVRAPTRTSRIRWILANFLLSMPLAAQGTNHVALVVGLHGPGVLVPVSSTAAFRLDGTLSETSTGGLNVWNETVGVSAVFYIRSSDALRSYVGPRLSYSHVGGSGGANANTWSGQLFCGAEYALGRRFGVFGEAGLSYGRATGTRIGSAGETIRILPTASWSTVNGVGALYRF